MHALSLPPGLPSSVITGSDDLLTRFGLAGTYDRAVKQYLNPSALQHDVKGKGRAIENGELALSPSNPVKAEEEGATGTAREKGKTIKKHYSHMIADVPGKLLELIARSTYGSQAHLNPLPGQNKLAKDHVLRDLLMNPEPPDHVRISSLDDTALREAFTLEVGMLPDVRTYIACSGSCHRADSLACTVRCQYLACGWYVQLLQNREV